MNTHSEVAVHRWWQSMFLVPSELPKGIWPAPTKYAAQLKRCDTIEAAMLTEGFRALWLALPESITHSASTTTFECWACIAMTLVRVTEDTAINLATAAGSEKEKNSGSSQISEMRFARLISAKNPNELLRRLRRILIQLKGQVSVMALSRDIEQWFSEHDQFRPRKADKRISVRWAMDYYQAAPKKQQQQ